ncbi:MAG TPA: hypothetical protein VM240_14880 [Verrucomicrobiae bacterium]|nr:hypothetical protein [Verrucomicrobiae bacterium]
MRRRKNYAAPAQRPHDKGALPPWTFVTKSNNGATVTIDLRRWQVVRNAEGMVLPADREPILLDVRNALNVLRNEVRLTTLREYIVVGLYRFFDYLDDLHRNGNSVSRTSDITLQVIEGFMQWLQKYRSKRKGAQPMSLRSQSNTYGSLKNVFNVLIAHGLLDQRVFPKNPYPGALRSTKGSAPYSEDELRSILRALTTDLDAIRGGAFRTGSDQDVLWIYLALIAARTGRNPGPLKHLFRDALVPNPLKPGSFVLVGYKVRGNRHVVVPVKGFDGMKGKGKHPKDAGAVGSDVAILFNEVLEKTHSLVETAPPKLKRFLFLYRNAGGGSKGAFGVLSNLPRLAKRFKDRHALRDRNGKVLAVTISRLRKTFGDRAYRRTRDLATTAALLGNSIAVADSNYLPVTPELEKNHHFCGLALEATFRGKSDDAKYIKAVAMAIGRSAAEVAQIFKDTQNTGVAKCSSPLYGRYAPKDGINPCDKFIYCFKCPNQVITGDPDDLHRMFSFYWFLKNERKKLGRNGWTRAYKSVITVIDKEIAPRFPTGLVREMRERAFNSPHPMWQRSE